MKLTDRQKQVLDFIARGLLNKQIGAELGISEQTVKNHITNLLRKLGALNRAHAVMIAKEEGLLPNNATGCDFKCAEVDEPMIVLLNTETGHVWYAHLSCLKEYIELQEGVLDVNSD